MTKFLPRQIILHRWPAALLCALLITAAAAQAPKRKTKGPRALALVEWTAPNAPPRIIPVTILVDGRYYDASIYKADPVPMALEPGTVYEVEKSGASAGFVWLTTPRQASNGAWYSGGRYQTNEQLAAARKPKPAPKQQAEEGPPKLRKGSAPQAASVPPPPPGSQGTAPADESGEDDRPVLRRPPAAAQPEPAPAASKTTAAAEQPSPEEGPHPILRRGRPTAEPAEELPPMAKPGSKTAPANAPAAKPAAPVKVMAAISDAGGPEPHTYVFPWSADELQRARTGMIKLAAAALDDFARTHGGTRPGQLEDLEVRAFDLATNNEPYIVLSARAGEAPPAAPPSKSSSRKRTLPKSPAEKSSAEKTSAPPLPPPAPSGLQFWITMVARQDYSGELRKLKVWATDSRHLDAYPRMELIDVVDADGDGRGEFLFREITDRDRSFVLYRGRSDQLLELYNSAELEQ
ncbi:MAG: hypothetical protein ACR2IF_09705 [Terriglobales bacterium]